MPDVGVKSLTVIIYWRWINSGTCAASSAASVNWRWSPSSRASPRTAAFTAKRITTGEENKHGDKTHTHHTASEGYFSLSLIKRDQDASGSGRKLNIEYVIKYIKYKV